MKKHILSTFLTIACIGHCFSQQPAGAQAVENLNSLEKGTSSNNVQVFDNRYKGIKGTPFVLDQWKAGEITLKVGDNVPAEAIKYDVVEEKLLLKKGEQVVELNIHQVKAFTIQDRGTFVHVDFISPKPSGQLFEKDFLEHFYPGEKYQLYIEHDKKLKKADYKGAYSSSSEYDEFKDQQKFYLSDGSTFQEFKLRKKDVKKLFGQEGMLLIKEHKLNIKNVEDLIELMGYLNKM